VNSNVRTTAVKLGKCGICRLCGRYERSYPLLRADGHNSERRFTPDVTLHRVVGGLQVRAGSGRLDELLATVDLGVGVGRGVLFGVAVL